MKTRTGTKIAMWAIIAILFMTFIRADILPLFMGGEKLKLIESHTPAIITPLLWVAVVFFWGNEGRKTVENIFGRKENSK